MTVKVSKYKRQDGTEVKAHKRSDPDFPELKFSKQDLEKIDFDKSLQKKVDHSDSSFKAMVTNAKETHSKRSPRARDQDNSEGNDNTYKMTERGVKNWKKHPGKYDLEGIDTPRKKGCNKIFHNNKKGLLSLTMRCNENHLCDSCKKSSKLSTKNEWFVYEGKTLRAAQSTKEAAMKYMKPGYKLIQGEANAIKYERSLNQSKLPSDRYEVWFQYNKSGNWKFRNLESAQAMANKYYNNKPIIYDLQKDKIHEQYSKDKSSLGEKSTKKNLQEQYRELNKEMTKVVDEMVKIHDQVTRSDLQGIVQAKAMSFGKKYNLSERKIDQIDNEMLERIDKRVSNQSKSKIIPLKYIKWEWNEGLDLGYDGKMFRTWQAFQQAVEKVHANYVKSGSGGYDKIKFSVKWSDGTTLTDRLDVGSSPGDYHLQEPVGLHIKQSSPMYKSTIEKGQRDRLDWGKNVRVNRSSSKPTLRKSVIIGASRDNKGNTKAVIQDVTSNSLKTNLKQFTGTNQYHQLSYLKRLKSTDGVKYLADQAQAYWLIDLIESYQPKLQARGVDFQVWTLKVNKDEGKVKADDGNGKIVASQTIPYTDFPIDQVKLYVENGVLMLPSER